PSPAMTGALWHRSDGKATIVEGPLGSIIPPDRESMVRRITVAVCACLAVVIGLGGLGARYALRPNVEFVPDRQKSTAVRGERPAAETPEQEFSSRVRPFLEQYCWSCHGSKKPKGELDLTGDATVAAVAKNVRQWELVLERLRAKEMPP